MINNSDTFQNEPQNKNPQQGVGNDLLVIISLLKDNWYFFLIAVLIALSCARFYIGHTLPVYQTTATVQINETGDRPMIDNSELLMGLGLPGGMKNLENQIMILKSRALTETTLKELPFMVEYYFKTVRNRLPIYPESPLKIISDDSIPLPKDIEFLIVYLGNKMFRLESQSDNYPLQKTASFGEDIEIPEGSFRIECMDENWIATNSNKKLCFIIYSTNNLISQYCNRINVQRISREGSILDISMIGTNRAKDADFLNKHLEKYQNISLNRKNTEAERRIQFIDDQLVGISDSLSTTENKLQKFRSTHRIMDLSAQGQALIAQVTLLENERARLELEASYYDYLADYLAVNTSGELPIVPITMGINDTGLTRLVEELATLQGQLSTTGAGGMNPLQRNLEQRVRSAKDALKETLNGLRRANSLARSENQSQISRANSQASSLPVTERQLLGIERKFKLNDELYTFLLETRAEQQMQKASNRADSEMVDPADSRFSALISPNRIKIYLIALFSAFATAFLLIYLKSLLGKKLKDEDIRKMTDLPIVGNIPHNPGRSNTVVVETPDSSIAEAFRLLRSRMQFFTKEVEAPVILITSSMPGEGKTFTSINIASAYSLLDKRTVLIGFDLRKPKIFQDFNLHNEKGVSTWLIGKDQLQDIIQETSFKNLSVISAGPVPPNPSELTALSKTEELIKLLRQRFDYIIIDSSPIGVVSDTYHLATLADACLLVVRSGHTLKDMLMMTLSEINSSRTKGVSIVINDIQSDSKHYGYGEKYGYTKDKKQSKRNLFKRRKVK